MRFYEFETGRLPVYNLMDSFLKECGETTITEALSTETLIKFNKSTKWLSNYITNPNELTIGDEYIPVTFILQAAANICHIEVRDESLTYIGVNNNEFIFKNLFREFQVPVSKLVNLENNAFFASTTVFVTADEANQFILMVQLKFKGDWTFKEKKL